MASGSDEDNIDFRSVLAAVRSTVAETWSTVLEIRSERWSGPELEQVTDYLKLFKGRKERNRHVRVVFTGRVGAGKTTICRRLQKKHVNLKDRQPTIGAVLHPAYFLIDWASKKWDHYANQTPKSVIISRLGALVKNKETSAEEAGSREEFEEDPLHSHVSSYPEALQVADAAAKTRPDGVFLSMWDMGGHTSFLASHNVFISSHGVYLLVFRLTDFLKDKLETDRLKKWIRLIGTFSSVGLNALRLKTHDPPLIIVGTFLDELKKTTKDYEQLVNKIWSSITKFPELSPYKFVKFCTVDNSLGKKGEDLRKLRSLITDAAIHQDQWERELPARWLKLEMDIVDIRQGGTRILTLRDVIELNRKSIAKLEDDEEIKLALEYLHCIRSVIYFREFDFVITDPHWLADFFSILLTDEQFLPKDDLLLTRDLELYTTKGELTQELIDGLLSLEKNQEFRPHKGHLLALMEKFGLIVKILMSGTTTQNAEFSQHFTIPSKLVELQNVDDIANQVHENSRFISRTLCFVFKDVFVPDELFHRIFAKILRTYKATSPSLQYDQTTTGKTTCLYSGFGCFEVDDLCRVIVSMQTERSTIAVTLISLTESKLPADSGPRVRQKIEQILQDTLQMSSQLHFQYTHQLHCNIHLGPYDTPVQLYGVIHSENGVPCKGMECRGQHRLTNADITFWDIGQDLPHAQSAQNLQSAPDRGHEVGAYGSKSYGALTGRYSAERTKEDIISNRRLTPRELGRLSRLVSSCNILFTHLGLSSPDIDTTNWESPGVAGITIITKVFLKWTRKYPNQTIEHIQRALKEAGLDPDLVFDVLETDDESQCYGRESIPHYGKQKRLKDELDMVPDDVWNRNPSDIEMAKIVKNIGNTFFNLCLELGLSPQIIEQHELGHPVTFQARMNALLRYWRNSFSTKATIGRLLTAMKLYDMDWHTTAQIWSQ